GVRLDVDDRAVLAARFSAIESDQLVEGLADRIVNAEEKRLLERGVAEAHATIRVCPDDRHRTDTHERFGPGKVGPGLDVRDVSVFWVLMQERVCVLCTTAEPADGIL